MRLSRASSVVSQIKFSFASIARILTAAKTSPAAIRTRIRASYSNRSNRPDYSNLRLSAARSVKVPLVALGRVARLWPSHDHHQFELKQPAPGREAYDRGPTPSRYSDCHPSPAL